MLAELLEVAMVVSFGAAWPASILKSYRARTAKGKSITFLSIVEAGYLFGIASKFASDRPVNYVVLFYIINFVAVGIDILLYFRNRRLDKLAGDRGAAA
ncbi:MAG: hypothetical protein LIP77_11140 [Planctomycetes bacterium]|nr:hypothetical protein [Planctomycetota bacterium]